MDVYHFPRAVAFGEQLLSTQDLDPVYVALWDSGLTPDQLERLVVAYSCLYHLGAAAKLSEFQGRKFWDKLDLAALNPIHERWPRGSERRHWRGQNALDSVAYLRSKCNRPEDVINTWLGDGRSTSFQEISKQVQSFVGFGPWMAFKIADLGERVLHCHVDFDDCELGIYRDPRQGAALLLTGDKQALIQKDGIKQVVSAILHRLGKHDAPPLSKMYKRRINIQEVETILCKYKSHVNGHYPLGKDTLEVLHGLSGWGKIADRLAEVIRPLAKQWESEAA